MGSPFRGPAKAKVAPASVMVFSVAGEMLVGLGSRYHSAVGSVFCPSPMLISTAPAVPMMQMPNSGLDAPRNGQWLFVLMALKVILRPPGYWKINWMLSKI